MRYQMSTSGQKIALMQTVTSGERDASQPQVRDQAERLLLNLTNTVNSWEAEQ